MDPADFHVVFAYPWPDEEEFTAALFRGHGARGAVLVSHHGGEEFRLRRNAGRRGRAPQWAGRLEPGHDAIADARS